MKILVISTSRADWNSLGMVAGALTLAGADVDVLSPEDSPANEQIARECSWLEQIPVAADPLHRDADMMVGVGVALDGRSYDWALLCGDRHETASAALACATAGVPIAHLAGGDVSSTTDELYRHAISKLSQLHFPTHDAAAFRLLSMGESRDRVAVYGSASVDRLLRTPVLPLAETTKQLGLVDSRPFLLVNYQPITPTDTEMPAFLAGLQSSALPAVIIGPNVEHGDRTLKHAYAALLGASHRELWRYHDHVPTQVYLSALAHCAALVGNSSSGFYEAPYYGTRVVNVGTRQDGRDDGRSFHNVMTVPASPLTLSNAIRMAVAAGRAAPAFPFGRGDAAVKIARHIIGAERTVRKEWV